jgi:hypothetical protein
VGVIDGESGGRQQVADRGGVAGMRVDHHRDRDPSGERATHSTANPSSPSRPYTCSSSPRPLRCELAATQ